MIKNICSGCGNTEVDRKYLKCEECRNTVDWKRSHKVVNKTESGSSKRAKINEMKLPSEITITIFSYLDYKTLFSKVNLVCKQFDSILNNYHNDFLWKVLFDRIEVNYPIKFGKLKTEYMEMFKIENKARNCKGAVKTWYGTHLKCRWFKVITAEGTCHEMMGKPQCRVRKIFKHLGKFYGNRNFSLFNEGEQLIPGGGKTFEESKIEDGGELNLLFPQLGG